MSSIHTARHVLEIGSLLLLLSLGIGCQQKKGDEDAGAAAEAVKPQPEPEQAPQANDPPKTTLRYTLQFAPQGERQIGEEDSVSTLASLRARLADHSGKVDVRRDDDWRFTVDLEFDPDEVPDEAETAEIELMMTRAAQLSFQMAHPSYLEYTGETDPAEVNVQGATLLPFKDRDEGADEARAMLVQDKVEIRGDQIKRASAANDFNRWQILINLNKEGGDRLHELSQENNAREFGSDALPFAIILDGEILSAPVFHEPIAGGTAMISGDFSAAEARGLASAMLTPLAIPLKILETKVIPPSDPQATEKREG